MNYKQESVLLGVINLVLFFVLLVLHNTLPYGIFKVDVDQSISEIIEVILLLSCGALSFKILPKLYNKALFRSLGIIFVYLALDDYFSIHERFGIYIREAKLITDFSNKYSLWNQSVSELLYFGLLLFFTVLILGLPFLKADAASKKVFVLSIIGIFIASLGAVVFDFLHDVESLKLNIKDPNQIEDSLELFGFFLNLQIMMSIAFYKNLAKLPFFRSQISVE